MALAAPPTGRARILVVDDEMGPRESLRMLLKPAYEIKTAESARAALDEIGHFRPDLVVLDIKMPEMDGLEVLRRIKQVDASIEVVMITAYASLETVKLALSHGAFEYLIKPFSRQDLEDVVRRAVERRRADQGARGEVARLVDEMRRLSAKTEQLEEVVRREAPEQSLRVTQLSIVREIARAIVAHLDPDEMTAGVTHQLQRALGYDDVRIVEPPAPPSTVPEACLVRCEIHDAEGVLGTLVVDNRGTGRSIGPREREVLSMLSEFLAVALRNSRLYTEIATTKRSLEQLVNAAGDGIIVVAPSDHIESWNPAAERIFGLSRGAAVGRTITDFLPGADFTEAKRRLGHGLPMQTFEVTAVGPSGRNLALFVTLSAVRERPGVVERLIAIVHDVTVQREVEAQMQQADKLSALGQLAGGIAHDFNNLLQAILGYTQLMKQNVKDVELVARSLKVLESAAIDGAETVRRIQQFARLRPDEQFVPVSINAIVEESVAIVRPRWEEKRAHENRPLHLQLELESVPPVSGRPAALTEVLTNLILNAIDAMPQGGTLTIGTRPTPDAVVITVSDTGVGMTDTVRKRIFEPFFSTKGEGGSGLGLAMSYSIVKRHGGEIRVETEVGWGTTFTLTFPNATGVAAGPPPAERALPRRTARVLLVDDDAQVLGTLSELLQSIGHAVTAMRSGAEVIAYYQPGCVDIVLTNVGMAGMNGWQLAERLRARDQKVAIVFITGWGLLEEDHARLAALGIKQCLFKPVRPADLDDAIQTALQS